MKLFGFVSKLLSMSVFVVSAMAENTFSNKYQYLEELLSDEEELREVSNAISGVTDKMDDDLDTESLLRICKKITTGDQLQAEVNSVADGAEILLCPGKIRVANKVYTDVDKGFSIACAGPLGTCILDGSAGTTNGILDFESSNNYSLKRLVFANGSEKQFQGGGVYILGNGDFLILNCLFLKNEAALDGGALYFEGVSGGTAKIMNSIFIGNKGGSGGAISHNELTLVEVENCEFKANEARVVPGADPADDPGTGGAISGFTSPTAGVAGLTTTVRNSKFLKNKAGSTGGIAYYGQQNAADNIDITWTGNYGLGNNADTSCDGVFVETDGSGIDGCYTVNVNVDSTR